MSTPAVTPERVCACGCGLSMEGRRPGALYALDACKTRDWRRRKAKAAQTPPVTSHKPSGLQVSHAKSIKCAQAMIEVARECPGLPARDLAERFMQLALPAKQRAALQERSAA